VRRVFATLCVSAAAGLAVLLAATPAWADQYTEMTGEVSPHKVKIGEHVTVTLTVTNLTDTKVTYDPITAPEHFADCGQEIGTLHAGESATVSCSTKVKKHTPTEATFSIKGVFYTWHGHQGQDPGQDQGQGQNQGQNQGQDQGQDQSQDQDQDQDEDPFKDQFQDRFPDQFQDEQAGNDADQDGVSGYGDHHGKKKKKKTHAEVTVKFEIKHKPSPHPTKTPHEPSLPITGSSITPIAAAGGALLLAGVGLGVMRRMRRN